jgi:hypothetical protein
MIKEVQDSAQARDMMLLVEEQKGLAQVIIQ